MTKILHKSDFEPHLEQVFKVDGDVPHPLDLTLVEVNERGNEEIEHFSIIFRGPKEPVAPQKTYKMTHPAMGEFRLFLVPIVYGKQDGMYYQSIFNRFIDKE